MTCNLCEFLWIWGDQSSQSILKSPWIFIGRADAEAPTLWPPDVKSQLIGKGPGTGKDWGQEEKGATEGEMVGWHHQLNRHEFEQTLGDGEGQGSLVLQSMGSQRVRHDWATELNWMTKLITAKSQDCRARRPSLTWSPPDSPNFLWTKIWT